MRFHGWAAGTAGANDVLWQAATRTLVCSLVASQATVVTHAHADTTMSRFAHPTSAITPGGTSSGGAAGRPPSAWMNVAIIRTNVPIHTTTLSQVKFAVK